MEKYKVKLTFIEEVEATNEQDAIIIAYDGVVASGYNDAEVEKRESEEKMSKKYLVKFHCLIGDYEN